MCQKKKKTTNKKVTKYVLPPFDISSSYKIRNPDVLKLYSGVGHHIGSGSTVILVEYLATQTGGATVNNSFTLRLP